MSDDATRTPAPDPFRYFPELDGIRALAVVAVVAFHAGLPFSEGGFLGVDLFFVLSGYLITSLLIREHRLTGRISIRNFYIRRALRLLPALLVVLVACGAYRVFAGGVLGRNTMLGVGTSLTYLSNWVLATGRYDIGLLSHTWSLSIEEQFYLVAGPTLAFLLARQFGLRALMVAFLSGVVLVAVSRFARWEGPASLVRLYYGSDSRADALLIGCALAAAGAAGLVPGRRWLRTLTQVLSLSALAWLVILVTRAPGLTAFFFRGGFTLVALLTAVVIYQLVYAPMSILSRILRAPPLVLLGRMSYGVYLWHYVVFRALFPVVGLPGPGMDSPARTSIGLVLTFVIATASYLVVEQPILRLNSRFRSVGAAPGRPIRSKGGRPPSGARASQQV